MIKNVLCFFSKIFFWLCKWSLFRVHQNTFQKEKSCLRFLGLYLCLIHEDMFYYTLFILDIYQFLFSLKFLTIIFTLHIDSVR